MDFPEGVAKRYGRDKRGAWENICINHFWWLGLPLGLFWVFLFRNF